MPRPPQKPVPPRPADVPAVAAAPSMADAPAVPVAPAIPAAPAVPAVPKAGAPAVDDDAVSCAVFDDQRGRPCGQPVEAGTLTCVKHRVRPTRTQISRNDAARRRFGG